MVAHTDNAPCFVLEDVPGTLPGSRVLLNFFDGKRKNMTLGFPTDMSKVELSEGFRTHYAADMKRIPPTYVESGPVMQNVLDGDEIDLRQFPVPIWHAKDGGRYIGTAAEHRHPRPRLHRLGQVGTYRMMIFSREELWSLYLARQARPADPREVLDREPAVPVAVVVGGGPA